MRCLPSKVECVDYLPALESEKIVLSDRLLFDLDSTRDRSRFFSRLMVLKIVTKSSYTIP